MTPQFILTASLCRLTQPTDRWHTPEAAKSQIENMMSYSESVNADTGEKGILVADWNYFPRGVDTLLERYGFELDWEDTSTSCDECGKHIHTQPGYYGDTPYYWMDGDNGGIICHECTDAEEYLEYCEDAPERCVNLRGIDPAEHNYVKIEGDFESGLHPGQTDNPQAIYKRLSEKYDHIIFVIDDVGQFDARFSVWRRKKRITCDCCQMLAINGIACHETGCRYMGARWDEPTETWIRQRKCFDCGCTVDADDPCCSAEHDDDNTPDDEFSGDRDLAIGEQDDEVGSN